MSDNSDSLAAEILGVLSRLCEEKESAWMSAADAVESASMSARAGARYTRNVAHGEHMAAIEALYAARAVANRHGLVSWQ